jgi:hypothetical protein
MADLTLTPNQKFVRIHFSDSDLKGRKLRYKHKDLRDVVAESGKSLGELLTDPFGGWPYLLRYGLRHQDLTVSLDKASDFIDLWMSEPDAETKQPRTMDQLGLVILAALNASGFVKIAAENSLDDTDLEGNAQPTAATLIAS